MSSTGPDLAQIKAAMRAQWTAGDFGVVAKTVSAGAEAFANRLALEPGLRVLDVACGTGNLALPLARMGCQVTGLDLAPNLLMQARERAAAEHLEVSFDEGDAEQLPYADAQFDVAVTMFGAMFAPRPEVVALELARVLKPGGLLAMANWNPESFSAAMFRVSARHVSPPPGLPPPVLWGDDTTVHQRLAPHFHEIRTELIPIDFDLPTDAAGAVSFFRQYFGPTQVAFSRLDPEGQSAFARDLEALWSGANVAPDPSRSTLVHNEYRQVLAIRS